MIGRALHGSCGISIALFVVLLLPPTNHLLQASMTTQMLIQIPLLAAVGWLLRDTLPQRITTATNTWNRGGITGLVLAVITAAFWMLPRSLDAAVTEPLVGVAKFVSVPLLIGLPLSLSWRRVGFVVRGLFLLELTAMCFRLGWLYLISPVRLCSNYLLGDQQWTGRCLLGIGAAILLWIVFKLLCGHFDHAAREASVLPRMSSSTSPDRHVVDR